MFELYVFVNRFIFRQFIFIIYYMFLDYILFVYYIRNDDFNIVVIFVFGLLFNKVFVY